MRSFWRCGWIPESERDAKGKVPIPEALFWGDDEKPDVCSGYLVQLPQVIEAARAYGWRKDGALREFYDGKPLAPLTKTALDIMGQSLREVEQHRIRTAAKREE